ncbi:hypothetical protein [Catellatospora sp. NPDC049609]|uniref:5'-methylthioadenosine/S-adenosylhomocysteine nucleosidase family protein n=1 Tax=Catellatospora sp. NPDC049609 TaxID=3155505 RepID=UPI00341F0D23
MSEPETPPTIEVEQGGNQGIQHFGHGNIVNTGAVGKGATVYRTTSREPRDRPRGAGEDRTSADVGVIVATPREFAAVARALAAGSDYRDDSRAEGTLVAEATMPVPGGAVRVAALEATEQGTLAAQTAYRRLTGFCAPSFVLLVGIAGGIDRSLGIGDVVLSDHIICYGSGKDTPDGRVIRGSGHQITDAARERMNRFFARDGRERRPLPLADATSAYLVHQGPVGSADTVVAWEDAQARRFLKDFNDKTLAVEMEAAGVAAAFHSSAGSPHRPLGWFTVRGISDLADVAKKDEHQDLAARHAADVMVRLLPFLRVTPPA